MPQKSPDSLFSVEPLCSSVSQWLVLLRMINHRGTENTEVAQRNQLQPPFRGKSQERAFSFRGSRPLLQFSSVFFEIWERESAPAELMRDSPATDAHDQVRGPELPFGRVFYVVPAHHRMLFLSPARFALAQRETCIKQDYASCQEVFSVTI